jgi:hypothetical protein
VALFKYEGMFDEIEVPALGAGVHIKNGESTPIPDELVAGLGPDWSEVKPKTKADKEKNEESKKMSADPAPADIKSKDNE